MMLNPATKSETWSSIYFLCSVKVLLLHQHFNTPYTGGAIRSYYLAKALVDAGITTVVVTAYNGKKYRKADVDGIEVHFLPIAYNNNFGFYRRSISFIKYVWQAIRMASKVKDADICYAISVPLTVGIAARFIRSQYRIPYIFEVGDLWPDAPIEMGFVRSKVFQRALYQLEKNIYRNAIAIVALSLPIQQAIEKKISGKKISVIPNMADSDFFFPKTTDERIIKKFNVENQFVVSYVGAIGVANGLDHFLACAKASQDAQLPVHFIMCGEGAMLTAITKQVKALQLKKFSLVPFQNRNGVKEILTITDASFISYQPFPILETGSPNKYFDGLAAGKLIIVNFGGWIREEIEKNKCGFFVDQKNPGEFVKKVSSFIEDRGLLKEYQQSSKALSEKYSRTKLSAEFVKLIETQDQVKDQNSDVI
jgi:glycosyltransferase involved in cell wall biosynthesis